MSILGIDYGRVRVGLALADGPLVEPLTTIGARDKQKLLKMLSEVVDRHQVSTIVVGVSEGKMAEESRNFLLTLKGMFGIPVVVADETLTTKEAQKRLIEAKKGVTKRKELLDAVAAALILQGWLDRNPGLL